MANHALTQHFASFFKKLNPSPSFEATAASEHKTIRGLIENPNGPAASLLPTCFLQGSYRYKQDTAIYTINDVDLVVLCRLWQGVREPAAGEVIPVMKFSRSSLRRSLTITDIEEKWCMGRPACASK